MDADVSSAIRKIGELRTQIRLGLEDAKKFQQALYFTEKGNTRKNQPQNSRVIDRAANISGAASPAYASAAYIERYVKDKFKMIDNTVDQAIARVALRNASAVQTEKNSSNFNIQVKARLADLTRSLNALKATQDSIDGALRAAQSSMGIRNNRSSSYYSARQVVTSRADQEMIRRSQMSDADYAWSRTLERLTNRGGADLFATQAQLRVNSGLQSGMLGAVTASLSAVVELDKGLYNLQAVTGTSSAEMVGLKDNLIEVSAATKYTAVEITNAATTMAQAGLSAKEVGDSIGAVALLATASGTDLAASVDVVTSVLGQFDVRTAETTNIANVMTAALNESKLTMDKLALGLQYSGNIAAQSGVSYTELTAVLAGLSNAGIKSGSTIGTGIRQLMLEFLDPTDKLIKRLTALGLTTKDIDVKSNGFLGVLKNLKAAGFTTADAMQTLETRSANAFAAIANNVDYIERTGEMLNYSTAAAKANAIQMESLSNTWDRFISSLTVVSFEMFEPVIRAFQSMLKALTDLIQSARALGPLLGVLGTAIAGLTAGTALVGFTKLAQGLLSMRVALPGVAAGLGAAAGGMTMFGRAAMVLTSSTGVGLAFTGILLALQAISALLPDEAAKLDAIRGKVDAWKGRADEVAGSMQRVDEAITNILDKQATLDKDDNARKQTAMELSQAFKDLGFNIDASTASTNDMLTALNKLGDNLATQSIVALNGQLQKTIELGNAIRNQKTTSSSLFGWMTGRKVVDNDLSPEAYDLAYKSNQTNLANGDFGQAGGAYLSRLFGNNLVGSAADIARNKNADPNSIRAAASDISSLLTEEMQKDMQADGTDEVIKSRIALLEKLFTMLKDRTDFLDAVELNNIQQNEINANLAKNRVLTNPDFKSMMAGQGTALTGWQSTFDQAMSNSTSLADRGTAIDTLETKVAAYQKTADDVVGKIWDGMTDKMKASITREGLITAMRQSSQTRVTAFQSQLKTVDAANADTQLKIGLIDAKKRLSLAQSNYNRAKSGVGDLKTQKDIEDYKKTLAAALSELTEAQIDVNKREMDKIADKTDAAASREAKDNAEETLTRIQEIQNDAMDALAERQAKMVEDEFKRQIKSLDESIDQSKAEITEQQRKIDDANLGPGKALDDMYAALNALINKMTGLIEQKSNLIGTITDLNAPMSGTIASGINAGSPANAKRVMEAMMSQLGLSPAQVAGFVGNMQGESGKGLNPNSYVIDSNGLPSGGIAQWNGPRFNALRDFATKQGSQWNNLDTQIAFLIHELQTSQSGALADLKKQTTIEGSVRSAVTQFEKPKDTEGAIRTRTPFGLSLANGASTVDGLAPIVESGRTDTLEDRNAAVKARREMETSRAERERRLATLRENNALKDLEAANDSVAAQQQVAKSGTEVRELEKQFRDNSKKIMDMREKQIRDDDAAAKGIAPEETEAKVKAMQEEERKALNDRMNDSFKTYLDKLRERTYKDAGGELADARVAKMDGANESQYTDAERSAAKRQQLAAQERADMAVSNALLSERASLESQIASAKQAGNTENVTTLSQKLAAVNAELRQLPANYQAAGAAEGNVAQQSTISRVQTLTDEFLRGQGMEQGPGGNWQLTAQQWGENWKQALGGVGSAMKGLFTNLATGTMSAKDAFKQFALSIVQNLLDIATNVLSNQILAALFGGGAGGAGGSGLGLLGKILGLGGGTGAFPPAPVGLYAKGTSFIRAANGFNVPTRDSVPILAQPGEAILRGSAVSMIGRDGIDYLNGMGNRRASQAQKAVNDNGVRRETQRQAMQKPNNFWIVTPDQAPPPGPNDFVMAVADNINRGGSIKSLIKTVAAGRM